jgi:hypothetical protein
VKQHLRRLDEVAREINRWVVAIALGLGRAGPIVRRLNRELKEPGGPEKDTALLHYFERLDDIYDRVAGRPLPRSVGSSGASTGKPSGPGLEFLRLCVKPFRPDIRVGALAERIRELRSSRRR